MPVVFTTRADELKPKVGALTGLISSQQADTTGHAADKDREEQELEDCAHELGAALADWFEDQGREADAAPIDLALSTWQGLRDVELVAKAKLLHGKLIMAYGTGKTFTSLRTAEEMASTGHVLFLIPSLSHPDKRAAHFPRNRFCEQQTPSRQLILFRLRWLATMSQSRKLQTINAKRRLVLPGAKPGECHTVREAGPGHYELAMVIPTSKKPKPQGAEVDASLASAALTPKMYGEMTGARGRTN